eukprot:10957_1
MSTVNLLIASFGIICCFIISFVIIYNWIKTHKTITHLLLLILTYMAALSYLSHSILVTSRRLMLYSSWKECYLILIISYQLLVFQKTFLFFVFILRVDLSYSETALAFSRKFVIYPYSIFVLIQFIFFSWYTMRGLIVFDYQSQSIYTYDTKQDLCVASYPFMSTVNLLLVDIINDILCLFLFVRPMYKMLSISNDIGTNLHTDEDLADLIIKCIILVSITLGSSLIFSIMLSLPLIPDLWYIDDTINVFCLFGISNINHKIYFKLFGYCHNICLKCSGLYKFSNPMPPIMIQQIASKSNTKSPTPKIDNN